MSVDSSKETTGAWVIHHGRKLLSDTNGSAEFPVIDEAAKAATILTKLSESEEAVVPMAQVQAIAVASGINPRHELNGLLGVLQAKRLIDVGSSEIAVIGVTSRGALV
jgi:hypothetical protein